MAEYPFIWDNDEYRKLINAVQELASACTKSISKVAPIIIQINQSMERIRPLLDSVKTHLNILEESQLLTTARTLSKLQLDYISIQNIFIEFESADRSWGTEESGFQTISESEQVELKEDIISITGSGVNWQQKVMLIIEKWKRQNPVIANVFYILLQVIISLAIALALNMYTTVKQTVIREMPSANAPKLIIVPKNHKMIVIGEVPYYFEIEFEDPETGDSFQGWISKRSAKPFDEEELHTSDD